MTEIGIILALLVVAMGDNRISMNGTSTIAGGPDHCPPQKRDTRVVSARTHSPYGANDRDDL
jgi:hypothetical protein